jgi:hypothetical protein
VSLARAIEAVGHERARGTYTREVVQGLRALGLSCADRLRRTSIRKPILPRRAILHIQRYGDALRKPQAHWMLWRDGRVHDPGGRWPEGYDNWRITSYLEIY